MKSILFVSCCLYALLISTTGSAQNRQDSAYVQNYNHSALVRKVTNSDIVIEGKVIDTKYFHNKNPTDVHTSAIIRISKIFKGNISDTIIELVVDEGIRTDTLPDGTVQQMEALTQGGFHIQKGEEGIFLLQDNKKGNQLQKNLQSYVASELWINDILYSQKKGEPYSASCQGMVFKDVEKDLFQVIESITKVARKEFRKNMFGG